MSPAASAPGGAQDVQVPQASPVLVVQVTDAAYAQHVGVLWSSLATVHAPGGVRVVLFAEDPAAPALRTLASFARDIGLVAEVRGLDMGALPQGPRNKYVHPISYARLLLPRLLVEPRAIYLDADTVVRKDLTALWQHDLQGAWLGAVPDGGEDMPWQALGLAAEGDYINSGVLLLDLDAWRRHGLVEACEQFLATSPHLVRYMDQDVVNAVARGHVAQLGVEWNWMHHHPGARAERDPAVVHYAGKVKPWHYRCEHPWRGLYAQHLARTPWRGYRAPDRTLRRVLARWLVPGPLRRALRRLDARRRGHGAGAQAPWRTG
ncbi:MAG: glycosyltransferase family 8 protein [Planctomycetia bacterium]